MDTTTAVGSAGSRHRKRIGMRRNSLPAKLYVDFWDLDESRMNTCKIFWMMVLTIVFSPIILAVVAVGEIGDFVSSRIPRRERVREPQPRPTREELEAAQRAALARAERDEARRRKRDKRLEDFAAVASVVWFKIHTPVKWAFRILTVAVLVALVGYLGYEAATNLDIVLRAVLIAAALAGVVAVVVAVVVGLDRVGFWGPVGRGAKSAGRGAGGFFSVLLQFGRSFHDHTCADVELR